MTRGAELAGSPSTKCLFSVTSKAVIRELQEIAMELNSDFGKIHLDQLRHAGASHDLHSQARDLAAVRRRGRWLSWQGLRKCMKDARVDRRLEELDPNIKQHALECAAVVYEVLAGQRCALKGPFT